MRAWPGSRGDVAITPSPAHQVAPSPCPSPTGRGVVVGYAGSANSVTVLPDWFSIATRAPGRSAVASVIASAPR
jgi:hypothetical protein